MANEIIKGAGSHHIALMASDFEKSLAFYKALGFKEVARWGDEIKTIAMLDIGDGSRIELFSNGSDEYSVAGVGAFCGQGRQCRGSLQHRGQGRRSAEDLSQGSSAQFRALQDEH